MLFADAGLSTAQISSLFVIWSVSAFVLEVPTGALADVVSRRRLLVAGSAVYTAGFACWALWPSYAGFALGFVLWSASSAVVSGTYEAYVYDGLKRHDRLADYPKVIARGRALGLVANLAATLAAAPLFAAGGFALVGAVSVLVCVAQTVLALSLPPDDHRPAAAPDSPGSQTLRTYRGMLAAGLAEVARAPEVRHAVLLAAALMGCLTFDEYFGLLFESLGAAVVDVPVLVALTVAGQALGAWAAERMRGGQLPPTVAAAGVLLALGSVTGHPAGVFAIAAGYGLLQAAIVVAEVRLQQLVAGPARATVTSVAGLLGEVVSVGVFVGSPSARHGWP